MDETGLAACIQEAACKLLKPSRSRKTYAGGLQVGDVMRPSVYLIHRRGYWAISIADGVVMGSSALRTMDFRLLLQSLRVCSRFKHMKQRDVSRNFSVRSLTLVNYVQS